MDRVHTLLHIGLSSTCTCTHELAADGSDSHAFAAIGRVHTHLDHIANGSAIHVIAENESDKTVSQLYIQNDLRSL